MAKKKRGRPPGSKNKTKATPGAFAKMGVEDLRAYIGQLGRRLMLPTRLVLRWRTSRIVFETVQGTRQERRREWVTAQMLQAENRTSP